MNDCSKCKFCDIDYIFDEDILELKEHYKLPPNKKQCCGLNLGCYEFVEMQEKIKDLETKLAEERKKVVSELKVDIRSLFNSYASYLIDYCIWNKNADENQKLYNNFKRIINDRLVKVLDLFDKRIDQIERGTYD